MCFFRYLCVRLLQKLLLKTVLKRVKVKQQNDFVWTVFNFEISAVWSPIVLIKVLTSSWPLYAHFELKNSHTSIKLIVSKHFCKYSVFLRPLINRLQRFEVLQTLGSICMLNFINQIYLSSVLNYELSFLKQCWNKENNTLQIHNCGIFYVFFHTKIVQCFLGWYCRTLCTLKYQNNVFDPAIQSGWMDLIPSLLTLE